ncbi:MAG: tryptophan 7-halogenase [Actinomycetota bacterium]|nr:tryptophan 7-halogenase [Actinomycetota bacterium]
MPSVDVAVVGGGPAGAACAIRCAQEGLSVALVERSARPVSRPGESLHPGFEPLLGELGLGQDLLDAGFPRHDGHWVRNGDEACYVRYGGDDDGPWRGFQAGRAELDAMLLGRAEVLGVTLHRPWAGAAPVVEGGRVVGVSSKEGMIQARFVVDATGGRHWLARRRSLPIRYHSPPLIARFGYARGAYPALEAAPIFTAEPEGWSWAARVGEGLYAWTALALKSGGRVGPPEAIKDLTPLGKERRADVTWRSVRQAAGVGYYLVGDAAGVLDPASSHGVLRAVASGIKAGHLIASSLVRALPESTAARLYSEWSSRWLGHDLEALHERYAAAWAPRPKASAGTTLPAHQAEDRPEPEAGLLGRLNDARTEIPG